MSGPYYMKLNWGDWHKDTRHLTRAQHGAYFLLVGEAFRLKGYLPDDDAKLAAWALCTPEEWGAEKPIIMAFFQLKRGRWTHKRVLEEVTKCQTISCKRKRAGKAGGLSRRGKQKEIPEANAEQKASYIEIEIEPYNTLSLARVREEAGDALASMASYPGIASLHGLNALLRGAKPCDPEDVYAAVKQAAAWHRSKNGPNSMRTWTTAIRMAAENRDRRLSGAPNVISLEGKNGQQIGVGGGASNNRQSSHERQFAAFARVLGEGNSGGGG